ncbi:MAG TPA: flagellar hook-associated protein FlgK [Campylobacterales bacterium]|nr:flagellar hook-associated protein FlgK [Campylobacterales bacterium]HIO70573.1 flagellar hook-associated protein FlgK [Campylobacterales bacterium]
MGLFSTINTARTGLTSAQVGVDTTSHNISNAENKDYTRQRVVQEAQSAKPIGNSVIGNGAKIASIQRVHNEFVYTRYQQSSERQSYINTLKDNLEEISNYFPDMDGVGIKNDLDHYLDSWNGLAQDPSSVAQKEVVASSAENLVTSIRTTYDNLDKLHKSLDEQVVSSVDEVNRIIKDIASINGEIEKLEADGSIANDLRDKRDALETTLSKLVGAEFVHDNMSETSDTPGSVESEGLYSVIVGGVALVSGSSYHELSLENENGFHTIRYDRGDGTYTDMTTIIEKGSLGAVLKLRGDKFDEDGNIVDGLVPEYKEKLNLFAKGVIEETNSIYAESASDSMVSKPLNLKDSDNLVEKLGVNEGSFNIVVYDKDGNEVSKRVVTIDSATTLNSGENSLLAQLNRIYDDNGDNSLQNDFGSQFETSIQNGQIVIKPKNPDLGYTFGVEDNGTNFAGSTGLNRFFEGDDATNISLNRELANKPYKIRANKTPAEGDNGVADAMNRLKTSSWKFKSKHFGTINDTVTGMYNNLSVDISSQTEAINMRKESIDVQFKAIETQLQNISKVDIDTEMTNLMKYQTAYSASGKVITTIDRMIDTLLGIKQ